MHVLTGVSGLQLVGHIYFRNAINETQHIYKCYHVPVSKVGHIFGRQCTPGPCQGGDYGVESKLVPGLELPSHLWVWLCCLPGDL